MEAKLREYRALRRRKELIEKTKEKIENSKKKLYELLIPKFFTNMGNDKKDEEVYLMENEDEAEEYEDENEDKNDVTSEVSELESIEEEYEKPWRESLIRWAIFFCIWLVFYIIFLKLQFGAVYFVLTLLIGIYLNTRTRPRKKGEASAYSVFNKNCKSIDGTLKAEELEKQFLYGGAVKMF